MLGLSADAFAQRSSGIQLTPDSGRYLINKDVGTERWSISFNVGDGTVTIRRDGDTASETVEAALPALVSVTDQINEPRYPSFKGIMAAKKKPVETWALADLGVDASQVGLGAAWTEVVSFAKRPPRQQGQIITDDGEGGTKLAEFLAAQKFL